MLIDRKTEKVVKILDADFSNKFIFSYGRNPAVDRLQHGIVGSSLAFIRAHKTADRRSEYTLVNASRINEVAVELSDVPADIINLQSDLEKNETELVHYFSTE